MANESNLKQLRSKSSIKSRLTTFVKFIDNIVSSDCSEDSIAELDNKLQHLFDREKEYYIIQQEIEVLTYNASEEFEIGEGIENKFDKLIIQAEKFISKRNDVKLELDAVPKV